MVATRKNPRFLPLATALLGGVGCAGAAIASPVVYNFQSGSITITATVAGSTTPINISNTIALTGNQATFDAAAMTLTSFDFASAGSTPIALQGTIGTTSLTGETLTLTNLDVAPGTKYSGTATVFAPGIYNLAATNVAATGTYSLSGGLWNVGPLTLPSNSTGLTGSIQTAGNQFALNGISIGNASVTIGGLATQVSLKADISFVGVAPVPLPPAVWLLASGLGLLGAPMLRRRRTA